MKITPSERLKAIEDLNQDNWFCDNPNGTDIKVEILWLINRVKRLTEALEKYADSNYWKPDQYGDIKANERIARTVLRLDI